MIRQRVEAKEGEFGFYFTFNLKNADGSAYTDLGGTETVKLYLQKEGGSVIEVGSGHIHSTATGTVHLVIGSADVADMVSGLYLGEIEIAIAGSLLITNDVEVNIQRRIGP